MTSRRWNGGIIGVANIPSAAVARGVWGINEVAIAKRLGNWPSIAFWQTVLGPLTISSSEDGWNGYTIRAVIPSAALSIHSSGASAVKVLFQGPDATEPTTISKAYFGIGASSGDVYDYDATPIQLFFDGGSPSKTVSIGSAAWSDEAVFSIPDNRNLVIAMYINGGAGSDLVRKGNLTGYSYHFKTGDDVATVNATGYTSVSNQFVAVQQIDALQP